jgi:hypothetical protein
MPNFSPSQIQAAEAVVLSIQVENLKSEVCILAMCICSASNTKTASPGLCIIMYLGPGAASLLNTAKERGRGKETGRPGADAGRSGAE